VVTIRAVIVMAALAGCGEPTPLVCLDSAACGGGRCIDSFCADADPTCNSGFRYHESAGAQAGECTAGTGSGGGGASDDGGTFADPIVPLPPGELGTSVSATTAQHEITPSCATNPTGVDVMFEIVVPADLTRLYVDTDQTTFDVVLAVYEGSCAAATPAKELGCVDPNDFTACSTRTMQWSANVRAGVHCIVVDQASTAAASLVHVRGLYGPAAPLAQLGNNAGTTCGQDTFVPNGYCTALDGPDEAWFFMQCGGSYLATAATSWPGDIEVGTETAQYDCQPGNTGALFTLARPGAVWIVAHQASSTCSTVTLNVAPY
jgi:hypothetical protein